MAEKRLQIDSVETGAALFGAYDCNLKLLEKLFSCEFVNRESEVGAGSTLAIIGRDADIVDKAARTVSVLLKTARLQGTVPMQTVEYVSGMILEGNDNELDGYDDDCVCVTLKGKPIKPKTAGQREYTRKIKKNTIVLGIGPAGTGKTFLAVAMAVTALRSKEISRIILTRPAVEAGERLGYLPGYFQSKIDPYLRPLYDALFEMLGADNYQKQLERGVIEIAPLAYMRGRTLDDAFIILDEAQNTTPEQMKMFLTRLGNGSKIVVTGDLTQTDLPFGQKSGLASAVKILRGIEDIGIHEFSERDVVRHRLVQKIIVAYDKYDRERAVKKAENTKNTKSFRPAQRREND